jgi:hypothetical protein
MIRMNENDLLAQINETWSKEFDQLLDEPIGFTQTSYRARAKKWTSKQDLLTQYQIIAAQVLEYQNTKWYDPSWIVMWFGGVNYKKQWLVYQDFRNEMRIACHHQSPISQRVQAINNIVELGTLTFVPTLWQGIFGKFIQLFTKLSTSLSAGKSNMRALYAYGSLRIQPQRRPAPDAKSQELAVLNKKITLKNNQLNLLARYCGLAQKNPTRITYKELYDHHQALAALKKLNPIQEKIMMLLPNILLWIDKKPTNDFLTYYVSNVTDANSKHPEYIDANNELKVYQAQEARKLKLSPLSKTDMDYLIFIQCCGFLNLPKETTLEQLLSSHTKWMQRHLDYSDKENSIDEDIKNHLITHTSLIEQLKTLTQKPLPTLQVVPDIDSAYIRGKRLHDEVINYLTEAKKATALITTTPVNLPLKNSSAKILTAEEYYFYITLTEIFKLPNYQSLTLVEVEKRKRKLLATLHPDRMLSAKELPQALLEKFYKMREDLFIVVRDVANGLIKHFSDAGEPPQLLAGLDKIDNARVEQAKKIGDQCANNLNMPQVHYCLVTLISEQLKSIINPLDEIATHPELLNSLAMSTRESIKSILSGEFGIPLKKGLKLIETGTTKELMVYLAELEQAMEKHRDTLSTLLIIPAPASHIAMNSISFFRNTLSDQKADQATLYADEKGQLNMNYRPSL